MNMIMVAASIKNNLVVVEEIASIINLSDENCFDGDDFTNELSCLNGSIWGLIEDGEIDQVNELYGIEYLKGFDASLDELVSIGACEYPSDDSHYLWLDTNALIDASYCNTDDLARLCEISFNRESNRVVGFNLETDMYEFVRINNTRLVWKN